MGFQAKVSGIYNVVKRELPDAAATLQLSSEDEVTETLTRIGEKRKRWISCSHSDIENTPPIKIPGGSHREPPKRSSSTPLEERNAQNSIESAFIYNTQPGRLLEERCDSLSKGEIRDLINNQGHIIEKLNKVEVLEEKINRIEAILNRIEQKISGRDSSSGTNEYLNGEEREYLEMLPLGIDKFWKINDELQKNSSLRHKLIQILLTVSGNTPTSFISKVLRKLITDEAAEQISLTGKKIKGCLPKLKFDGTEIYKIVNELTFKLYKDAKESLVRETISEWLMQSRFRRARREARRLTGRPNTGTDNKENV